MAQVIQFLTTVGRFIQLFLSQLVAL